MKKLLSVFIFILMSALAHGYDFANFNEGYSKEDTDRIYRFLEENHMFYTLKLLNGETIESKKFTCKEDAELCQIQKARKFFKEQKYLQAEEIYADIPNRSFYWPTVLMERAWVNYYLKNYNRTLGLLSTFKFPLLKVFYSSEITYLTALSFFKLCYWGDAYFVIDEFKKNDLLKLEELKKTLKDTKNIGENKSEILENWFKTLKRTAYFSSTAKELMGLEDERAQLSLASKHVLHDILLKKLDTQVKARQVALNRYFNLYLKNKLDNSALFNEQIEILELEILSVTRKSQYQKDAKVGRQVGGYEYLPRTRHQFFWDFTDEFWADELGNYVFALKSQCEVQ